MTRTARDRAAYEDALARLPESHALALRLTGGGMADDEICRRLDIEPEALEPFLDLARRKLHRILTM